MTTPSTTTESLIKVLCVEDNADVADVLQSTIDAEPDMRCVGWLREAGKLIETVEQQHPDVIVYDLTMPGRDPFEALRELNRRFPRMPVVAFSAYDDLKNKAQAIDSGAWAFLSKHGDFQIVAQTIRRLAQVKADMTASSAAAPELTP